MNELWQTQRDGTPLHAPATQRDHEAPAPERIPDPEWRVVWAGPPLEQNLGDRVVAWPTVQLQTFTTEADARKFAARIGRDDVEVCAMVWSPSSRSWERKPEKGPPVEPPAEVVAGMRAAHRAISARAAQLGGL